MPAAGFLVTGGTGFIGSALARALMHEGRGQVTIIGRDFSRASALLAEGAVAVSADLRDGEAVGAACRGVDTVFHVGALSSPWARHPIDFYDVNVGGTEAVIAGCLRHGVRRLVYVSSPSVLSDGTDQENLTDDAPYPERFISEYSRTKKIGEDRVNAIADRLETVILRPKAVFGPGDTSLVPRLLSAARAGRLPQIGDGQNRVDLTYVDNVVLALLLAGKAAEAVGNTYTVTNGEPVLLWDVIRRLLRGAGISASLRRVPLPVALTVATLMEATARITGREPLLTRYTALVLARTQTHDITRACRDLGYFPRVSLEDGIVRTMSAFSTLSPEIA